jgi:hypothetical protein
LQTLANAPTEDGNGGLSRIVFAWFGTSANRLDPVCRDGLRALCAWFGTPEERLDPVRDCGTCHPWDGATPIWISQSYRLGYQAATEEHPNPAMRPTAHELVLSNPLRCTPIAVVEVAHHADVNTADWPRY